MNADVYGIVGSALIVGVPAIIAAVATLRGNKQIGTTNGGGTLADMMTQSLKWQVEHAAEDDARFEEERTTRALQIEELRAHREQLAIEVAHVAAELAANKKLLEERAVIHDKINAGVATLLKTNLLVQVAEDVTEIMEMVKTGNAQTLAQLADAIESRRIGMIPPGERTAQERDHIGALPEPPTEEP